MKIKVGFGYDVHQLADGLDLWLGGVKFEHTKGIVAHSDGDVLIHAICDALLGAANLRDIGFHFPNTDPAWAGADSKQLLTAVCVMLREHGWEISNIDASLAAERPKINPRIPEMQEALAKAMNISVDDVSLKATTNEKLGYVGKEEGINAYAVALIIGK
ncbi:MAG TPA: 2-C-methyl-D-erythritol 2,4-cyclodiphosphate synthase [Cytophagaceae bacterium]|jgi:2-C-methyl-D-erythritol 2,4-cyclodiphosphate synthase|nr:2-C-methyl-D-erythritol 2,4-cyclodiphosphate synthase [Cytophagaceae bacterium]